MDETKRVDDEAFADAYERHRVQLIRLGGLLTGDQMLAEDLVHDTFLASRVKLGQMDADDAYPYLRAAIVNAWRNVQRHRRVAERRAPSVSERPLDDPAERIVEHDRLWREIRRLPVRQRGVVVLRYYEDLPDEEIARLLLCRVRGKR